MNGKTTLKISHEKVANVFGKSQSSKTIRLFQGELPLKGFVKGSVHLTHIVLNTPPFDTDGLRLFSPLPLKHIVLDPLLMSNPVDEGFIILDQIDPAFAGSRACPITSLSEKCLWFGLCFFLF